jgi:hypothetical protein
VIDSLADFDRLIRQSRRACGIYIAWTLSLALLGLSIALIGVFVSAQEGATNLMLGVGGTFIATLGTFPLKEFLDRWERIENITADKEKWQKGAGTSSDSGAE